jgi:rod shape-determining protein MreD
VISQQQSGRYVIPLTLLIGFILTIMPLPEWASIYRPQWVALVVIYWCMAMPERIGVGISWTIGLLLDVLTGTLLGQHALGFSAIAYIMLRLHLRVRVMPLHQQAFTIFILLLVERLLVLWSTGAAGYPTPSLQYWITPVISTLLWPWVFLILRDLRRRFRVS